MKTSQTLYLSSQTIVAIGHNSLSESNTIKDQNGTPAHVANVSASLIEIPSITINSLDDFYLFGPLHEFFIEICKALILILF